MNTCTEGCFKNVINLGNSIIGVSILAMPYCFQKCGILLSLVVMVSSGLMTKISCHLLLKAAIMARRRNFEFLAFHTFGTFGKFAVELGIIGFLLGTCVAFFVVIGDLGPPLAADLFLLEATSPGLLRVEVLLFLGFFVALPLGLLRKVDSLTSFSFLSVCFYICLGLKILGESLSNLSSEVLWTELHWWRPSGLLSTLPIFFMALSCQTQLFEIFDTLNEPSLKRMDTVVSSAVHMCSAVYSLVGLFGYIAFYDQNITGNILVKLSNTVLTKVVKMAFVVTVIVSFPLCLFPCRSSLHSLIYKQAGLGLHETSGSLMIPDQRFRLLTLVLVASTICTAILLPDIEFVLGILGSTVGTFICFILPALVFIKNTSKNTNERLLAQVVLCIGLFILVACSYSTLHQPKKLPPAEPSQLAHLFPTPKRPLALQGHEASQLEEQFLKAKNVISSHAMVTEATNSKSDPAKVAAAVPAESKLQQPAAEKRQEPPVPQEPEEDKKKPREVKVVPKEKSSLGDPGGQLERRKGAEELAKPGEEGVPQDRPEAAEEKSPNADLGVLGGSRAKDNSFQNDLHPDALKKEDKELGHKKAPIGKKPPEEGTAEKQEALLRKIEQQQQEQKILLEEQRQLLQELKEHKESHDSHKAPAPARPLSKELPDAERPAGSQRQPEEKEAVAVDWQEAQLPAVRQKAPPLEKPANGQQQPPRNKPDIPLLKENSPSSPKGSRVTKEKRLEQSIPENERVAGRNLEEPRLQAPVNHGKKAVNQSVKRDAGTNGSVAQDSKGGLAQANILPLEARVMSERNKTPERGTRNKERTLLDVSNRSSRHLSQWR